MLLCHLSCLHVTIARLNIIFMSSTLRVAYNTKTIYLVFKMSLLFVHDHDLEINIAKFELF